MLATSDNTSSAVDPLMRESPRDKQTGPTSSGQQPVDEPTDTSHRHVSGVLQSDQQPTTKLNTGTAEAPGETNTDLEHAPPSVSKAVRTVSLQGQHTVPSNLQRCSESDAPETESEQSQTAWHSDQPVRIVGFGKPSDFRRARVSSLTAANHRIYPVDGASDIDGDTHESATYDTASPSDYHSSDDSYDSDEMSNVHEPRTSHFRSDEDHTVRVIPNVYGRGLDMKRQHSPSAASRGRSDELTDSDNFSYKDDVDGDQLQNSGGSIEDDELERSDGSAYSDELEKSDDSIRNDELVYSDNPVSSGEHESAESVESVESVESGHSTREYQLVESNDSTHDDVYDGRSESDSAAYEDDRRGLNDGASQDRAKRRSSHFQSRHSRQGLQSQGYDSRDYGSHEDGTQEYGSQHHDLQPSPEQRRRSRRQNAERGAVGVSKMQGTGIENQQSRKQQPPSQSRHTQKATPACHQKAPVDNDSDMVGSTHAMPSTDAWVKETRDSDDALETRLQDSVSQKQRVRIDDLFSSLI